MAAGTHRTPLTPDFLYQRALAIVDRDGLEALTMRRLAADVGVEAASLYHHVPNKQALLDGALALMRTEMTFPEPLPSHWADVIEMVFLRYLDVLVGHPNMLPLTGRHIEGEPAEGLQYLVANGFAPDDAVALWQSIISFVAGFAGFASTAIAGDTDYLPDNLAARMRQWDRETFRRTLRSMLRQYALECAVDYPSN